MSLVLMPAMALAQNRPQAGAAGGGGVGAGMAGGGLQVLMSVIKQLDLTAEQKTSVQGILKDSLGDMRDAATGMQDATPQERMQKMQDVQKIVTDAKTKVEGLLTAEQKKKYYPLSAKALLTAAVDRVTSIQTATGKMELTDDQKTKLKTLFDEDLKTLDGYKTDADAVTDDKGVADLQEKLTKMQGDNRRELTDILGQEDLQKLMQSMRTAGGRARGADAKEAPTTAPTK